MKRLRNAMFKASGKKPGRSNQLAGYDYRGKPRYRSVRNRSLFSICIVITPPKYETVRGQRRKVMPARGETRSQRQRDRRTHIFLAKIKAAKRLAGKLEFIQTQKSNRIVSFLRTGR